MEELFVICEHGRTSQFLSTTRNTCPALLLKEKDNSIVFQPPHSVIFLLQGFTFPSTLFFLQYIFLLVSRDIFYKTCILSVSSLLTKPSVASCCLQNKAQIPQCSFQSPYQMFYIPATSYCMYTVSKKVLLNFSNMLHFSPSVTLIILVSSLVKHLTL